LAFLFPESLEKRLLQRACRTRSSRTIAGNRQEGKSIRPTFVIAIHLERRRIDRAFRHALERFDGQRRIVLSSAVVSRNQAQTWIFRIL